MPLPSKLFTGYRALGFVSNEIPLNVRYHQKHRENYVVTCVGKAFQVYNVSRPRFFRVKLINQIWKYRMFKLVVI